MPTRPHEPAPGSTLVFAGDDATVTNVSSERPEEWPLLEEWRYELRGEHGRGGLGVVLRVFDRRLGREVAMKLLAAESSAERLRFAREATITARLQHPSIVTIFDVGRLIGDAPCYTMPLYPGRSLREAIEAEPTLPGRLGLLRDVLAVAEAMAHAHAHGVLHRDLKPSNIMLGALGETIVIDWGLAKVAGLPEDPPGPSAASLPAGDGGAVDGTRIGTVLGTPSYMPPEQARGERVDERADVYALGALLHHVIVGRPPFEGSSSAEILARVLHERPRDLQLAEPATPDDLATITRKAMAPERTDRYPDAATFARDLRRFLDGGLVEAHAYTASARVRRWLRRHRGLARLATVAVVVMAVLGALGVMRIRTERAAALTAAAEAHARADALVLTQAESALARDPTLALEWLATYPDEGADWPRVRALADDAEQRGVARLVLRRRVAAYNPLGLRPGGGSVVTFDGASELRRWDLTTGESSADCLGDAMRAMAISSLDDPWIVYASRAGAVTAWAPERGARELVDQHPGTIAVAASTDARWIAAGDVRGELRVHDRAAGTSQLLTYTDAPADELTFLPGSTRLVVLAEGRVAVWDVERGVLLYRSLGGARALYPARTGRFVAWTTAAGITWLDTETSTVASLAASPAVHDPVAFFPDGRLLVADQRRGAIVWEPRSGRTDVHANLEGGATAVSSDGRLVAVATVDGKVRVLDLGTGDVRVLLGHSAPSPIHECRFLSGDEELLTSSEDGTMRVWPMKTEETFVWRLDPSNTRKPELLVSSDGKRLVVAAPDGTLWRRDLPDGPPRVLGDNHGRVWRMAFLPDGEHLLTDDAAGALARWSLADGRRELVASKVPPLHRLLVAPDGRSAFGLSYQSLEAWRWDLQTGVATRLASGVGDFQHMLLSPDGAWLGFDGSSDGVHGSSLLEVATGRLVPAPLPDVDAEVGAFSPSSRFVFAAGLDGTAYRVELASGALLAQPLANQNWVASVALGDGLLLASSKDLRLRIWLPTLGLALTLDAPGAYMTALSRSPSGRFVVGAGSNLATYVWDLETRERRVLRGHDGDFNTASWAGDDWLVSSARDGTVRLWRRPDTSARSPRDTRAWFERLSRARLGDADVRAATCR